MTFQNPLWLNDGQEVWVGWNRELDCHSPQPPNGTRLRCVVETAHGDCALITNENRNFRRLLPYKDIWIEVKEVK